MLSGHSQVTIKLLYISVSRANEIAVVNTDTGALISTLPVFGGDNSARTGRESGWVHCLCRLCSVRKRHHDYPADECAGAVRSQGPDRVQPFAVCSRV